MTKRFVRELERLRDLLLEMGSLVEDQINGMIKALMTRDKDLARELIEKDKEIDDLEIKIDQLCEEIIALSQPVASDLRLIVAGFKMSNDLERMGDQAKNIGIQVVHMKPVDESTLKKMRLDVMTSFVEDMVTDALDAFVHGDAPQAKSVCDMDDEVDNINLYLMKKFGDEDGFGLSDAQRVNLLIIVQNLERIGDLATNIAEDVIFLVKAKVIKHGYEEFDES
ncbi:MAG: phosphate signaling complex protein PhoU [Candidatus Marinimicrobia bacterium]|nr:phosphate signaling complex protein PhoU [Candidatus Neomarinimicrobiota bacterium]MCF7828153.1 phosphate signaling complex protein PhoU [Candidatus Neomarinimicrobiota bacterium]MCF7879672.1 phosphate signaling complex protein PhoU [Candidatus Neomarinimicrobiota bacterium]